jgi:glycosyltransferase involved in cell wall biosynthesis
VGNLKPNKNLGRLLRAFDAIAGEFPGLKLYLVGRMEGLASPDAEIHKLVAAMAPGRVSLKGQVSFSDLKNYYANARLYALPSIYEGFGFPLLEAMAFGIPIVCSNAASLPEVGGEAVPYFDPLDTAAIADAMRTALRERPSGLAGKYRPHLETFTWEKAGRAHMDLIMDMFRPAAGRAAA